MNRVISIKDRKEWRELKWNYSGSINFKIWFFKRYLKNKNK